MDDTTRTRLEHAFLFPAPDKPAGIWVQQADLRALLAAYDTDHTLRATAEVERDHYHDLWVAACAARDAAKEYRAEWQAVAEEYRHLAQQRTAERDAAEQRATRLAALETAARAWAHDGSDRAESQLLDAVEALDGSAGESPVQAAGER